MHLLTNMLLWCRAFCIAHTISYTIIKDHTCSILSFEQGTGLILYNIIQSNRILSKYIFIVCLDCLYMS